ECQCTDNCDKRYCILQSQQGLHKIVSATKFQLAFEYAHGLELTDIKGRVCTGCKCAKDEYTGEEGQDRWIVEVVRQNFHVRPHHIPAICEQLCEKESQEQREKADHQGFAYKLENELATYTAHHLTNPYLLQPARRDGNGGVRQVKAGDEQDKHAHHRRAGYSSDGGCVPGPGIRLLGAVFKSHLGKVVENELTDHKIFSYLVVIRYIVLKSFEHSGYPGGVVDRDIKGAVFPPVVLSYIFAFVEKVLEIHERLPVVEAGILRLRFEYARHPYFLEFLADHLGERAVDHVSRAEQACGQLIANEDGSLIAQVGWIATQELKREHLEESRVDVCHR